MIDKAKIEQKRKDIWARYFKEADDAYVKYKKERETAIKRREDEIGKLDKELGNDAPKTV